MNTIRLKIEILFESGRSLSTFSHIKMMNFRLLVKVSQYHYF